ncbi:MAG: hypothetical protein RRZ73_04730 [Oscillospiraceae bacterium]
MIKLIVGNKGSGKTKTLVDAANNAVETTKGNVVCIEKGLKLTYDLNHKVRLIDTDEYKLDSYTSLFGFISGVMAGNYDITEVFVDGTVKIGGRDFEALADTILKIDSLAHTNDVNLTFSISADASELPVSLSKFMAR